MKPRLAPIQVQRRILAPVMQKAISVLLLPSAELSMEIEQELQSNPLLEIDETKRDDLTPQRDEELRIKIHHLTELTDGPFYTNPIGDEEKFKESPLSKPETLEDHLEQELRLEISDPLLLKIGEQIIGSINEDGYLESSCEEIARKLEIADTGPVFKVLRIIQSFDPVGIASRDLRECLLAQFQASCHADEKIVRDIIDKHLHELGKKKYKQIAKQLKVPLEEVKEAAHLIASLEPKPARNFRPIARNIYIKPDIFVTKDDDTFRVSINNADIPPLRISPYYKKLLNKKNLSLEERDFIEQRLQGALNFIKSIKQRGETLSSIVNFILKKQVNFFNEEDSMLAPLTLRDIGEAIGRDESTISRAIRSKYVDTPQGVFPLKFFFSSGIATESNGHVGSRSIIEEIGDMIKSEEKSSPLSDQDIQKQFKSRGINIARRTIAKYRQSLKIPPSHLRRE